MGRSKKDNKRPLRLVRGTALSYTTPSALQRVNGFKAPAMHLGETPGERRFTSYDLRVGGGLAATAVELSQTNPPTARKS